ncbi:hypothetical protein CEXT_277881 [Caerostris extrusa]|uniref:Uncharacterized protein n=1 Tax=Caerostris extrusa TaxID=172846 RepID=A0AAV4SHU8_CAEEX|nr:hypothetical protein CEXT_277881 [Caerostris extrusa]
MSFRYCFKMFGWLFLIDCSFSMIERRSVDALGVKLPGNTSFETRWIGRVGLVVPVKRQGNDSILGEMFFGLFSSFLVILLVLIGNSKLTRSLWCSLSRQ